MALKSPIIINFCREPHLAFGGDGNGMTDGMTDTSDACDQSQQSIPMARQCHTNDRLFGQ